MKQASAGVAINAAVVRAKGGPFSIEALTLEAPRPDEVLVKIVATGMCHTDMVARDKVYDVPHPIVLGHEGAGIVERVGEDVRTVAPGDPVVLTYQPCGRCKPCYLGKPFYCENTYALCFGGARLDGTTATKENRASAFTTTSSRSRRSAHSRSPTSATRSRCQGRAARAARPARLRHPDRRRRRHERAKVPPGSSFVAFGAGAVGLSAVMAARMAGATTIIASDVVPSRLEMAKELGATHAINSKQQDPVEDDQGADGRRRELFARSNRAPRRIASGDRRHRHRRRVRHRRRRAARQGRNVRHQ